MFCLLFLFWIILNGAVTVEIVVLGAAISAALTVCFRRVLKASPWNEVHLMRLFPRAVLYFFYLLWQIVWSNLLMIRVILFPGSERPCLVWFDHPVKKSESQLALANSITLTPGTVTVALGEKTICVYAVRPFFAQGLKSCGFVSRLLQMEEPDHD